MAALSSSSAASPSSLAAAASAPAKAVAVPSSRSTALSSAIAASTLASLPSASRAAGSISALSSGSRVAIACAKPTSLRVLGIQNILIDVIFKFLGEPPEENPIDKDTVLSIHRDINRLRTHIHPILKEAYPFLMQLLEQRELPASVYVINAKGKLHKRGTLAQVRALPSFWPYILTTKGSVASVATMQLWCRSPLPPGLQVYDKARKQSMPLFLQVVRYGTLEQIAFLLEAGGNPNETGAELYWAVKRDDLAIIQLLVRRGGAQFRNKKDYEQAVAIAKGNKNEWIVNALPPYPPRAPGAAAICVCAPAVISPCRFSFKIFSPSKSVSPAKTAAVVKAGSASAAAAAASAGAAAASAVGLGLGGAGAPPAAAGLGLTGARAPLSSTATGLGSGRPAAGHAAAAAAAGE